MNGNKRIDSAEVRAGAIPTYLGSPLPTREAFLRGRLWLPLRLTISATMDYRGGQKLLQSSENLRCISFRNCRGGEDPSAPLVEQAAFMAQREFGIPHIQGASFAKLREVSLGWVLPRRWLGPRSPAATLSLAGLDLATWTRYRGVDPEVTSGWFDTFARSEFSKSPIPRTIALRLDLQESARQ